MVKTLEEKLTILAEAAKDDASCSSSGSGRSNTRGLGSAAPAGICHSWGADGRCISLLKVLMTNYCIYDCAYCRNRHSNDIPRASFTVEELCDLTINFYRRNYIEGLFLSSGIAGDPDFTMRKMYKVVERLRNFYGFGGYIHVKAIPGASRENIEKTGFLADRMSVNIELPTEESLHRLAPQKAKESIFTPMAIIGEIGKYSGRKSLSYTQRGIPGTSGGTYHEGSLQFGEAAEAPIPYRSRIREKLFVPAGQSTQLIVGASPESDFQIVRLAQGLYKSFGLKRVYYSAYVPINRDPRLPFIAKPPLLREHRLYQADWLMRFYGFKAEEIVTAQNPLLDSEVDPKASWALSNISFFPVEVLKADYYTLLRVPGIGVLSARRILAARRSGRLDFLGLKKAGVVLKRAKYFITCGGKVYENLSEDPWIIRSLLIDPLPTRLSAPERPNQWDLFS